MRWPLALLCVGLLVDADRTAAGHPRQWEGGASFVFAAMGVNQPAVGRPMTIMFTMAGDSDDSARCVAHVQLPSHMHWIAGDTLHLGNPNGASKRWDLTVQVD